MHQTKANELCEKLISMGFDAGLSFTTAEQFSNKENDAIEYILNAQTELDHLQSKLNSLSYTDLDEKSNVSDSDDHEESAIVHDKDLRIPIYESKHRNKDIIKCIIEIRIIYEYHEYLYRKASFGTGTVFHVIKRQNGYNEAFVLTAAHNILRSIHFCKICNTSREKSCVSKCKHPQQNIWLKASKVEFRRRCIQKRNDNIYFGDMQHCYDEWKCKYIDYEKYKKHFSVKSGNDWAVLSFIDDDNYYTNKTTNIIIRKGINIIKGDSIFNIFGYPNDHKGKIFGMQSIKNNFNIEMNPKTNKKYLCQSEIDTVSGESGAALWIESDSKIIIFGIHTGGNARKKCNFATLIDDDILPIIDSIMVSYGIFDQRIKYIADEQNERKLELIPKLRSMNEIKCQQLQNSIGHSVILLYSETPSNDNDLVVSIELGTQSGSIFDGIAKVKIAEQLFGNFSRFYKYEERIICNRSFNDIQRFCEKYTQTNEGKTFSLIWNNCRQFMQAFTKYVGINYDIGFW